LAWLPPPPFASTPDQGASRDQSSARYCVISLHII
jgi:hypothetical protein